MNDNKIEKLNREFTELVILELHLNNTSVIMTY